MIQGSGQWPSKPSHLKGVAPESNLHAANKSNFSCCNFESTLREKLGKKLGWNEIRVVQNIKTGRANYFSGFFGFFAKKINCIFKIKKRIFY